MFSPLFFQVQSSCSHESHSVSPTPYDSHKHSSKPHSTLAYNKACQAHQPPNQLHQAHQLHSTNQLHQAQQAHSSINPVPIKVSPMKEQMQGATYCPIQKNNYCIYEPKKDLCKKVFIHRAFGALVPALAFDKKGHRLGRGGGYFDRVLKGFHGFKVGVAYSWQWIKDTLPCEEHDVAMDVVVSENRWEAFTSQGKHFLKGTF